MKATELQIGDWVGRVVDDKRIIEDYRQVDWIRTGEIGMRYQKVWSIGCIEPIPLTPEILEKNGFWVMENVNNGAEEYIAYATAGLMFHYNRDNDYYFPNTPISWKCVHELQHALRLCGLDELADNFKI